MFKAFSNNWLRKNKIIIKIIKDGIVKRDASTFSGITDCNFCREISIKSWDKLTGLNFD